MKKFVCILLILSLILPLSGCWNYRGLNDMTVITGVAIDQNQKDGLYHLTFETVDLSLSVKENGIKSKVIESDGETIFEAVRNAKKRLSNKLYFGQAQTVIIGEDLAKKEDMSDLIDWFIRDGECRETMCFLISQEATAADILTCQGLDQPIVANEIKKIVKSDQEVTASTAFVELYEIFRILNGTGKALALPAIHVAENNGSNAGEVNGIAVFKDQRMVGYLTEEESKYYLFAVNEIKGGLLTLPADDEIQKTSLEISKNKTETSFRYEDGQVKLTIKTDTDVYLDEYMGEEDALEGKQTAALEKAAEQALEENILGVIQKVQTEYDADIFGFGNLIYKKDLDLWKELKDDWDTHFQEIEVEVKAQVHIINTASVKET